METWQFWTIIGAIAGSTVIIVFFIDYMIKVSARGTVYIVDQIDAIKQQIYMIETRQENNSDRIISMAATVDDIARRIYN
jgi:tRNA A37 threonylcarbamoyladenosine dehydratase